ncbi:MAG: C25 family cysteine peptidase [Pyrinomonadaceae bacterium]
MYNFFDTLGGVNTVYLVESVGLYGSRTYSSNFTSNLVENLASKTGQTSAEWAGNLERGNGLIEKNEPAFSPEMQKELAANFLPPNLARQRMIAGLPGVKIGTKKEGFYRVSRTELQNAGFDVNGPSANWQLYKNGNEQAIIVGNNGDYIEFFGQGIDTNESGTQIYYLINGTQVGKRIVPSYQRPIAGQVIGRNYRHTFTRADRILYFNTLRNGDANNFFSDKVVNTAGANIQFNLDGIDFNLPKVNLTLSVQGFTLTPHNFEVTLNGESLGFVTGVNNELMQSNFEIPTSLLIEGTNTLLLKVPSSTADISFFDSVKVSYYRLYKAQQNALSFYTNPYRRSDLSGFTSPNIRVFDLRYPDSPTQISNLQVSGNSGDFTVVLPSNRSKPMFAVEDSAVLAVDSIEQNTPASLATPAHNSNLVIIAYKTLLTEAETWAQYRRNQGFTVEVVRVDDIFDEFNYGIVSADSIRSFLLYARDNWQTPPSYVLLVGDASWDPRNFTGAGNFNYVPTRMIDTVYEETGSDEAMADFDDDGLAEMAIGRIPARTGADVTQNFNKVTTFEQTSDQGFSRGAMFASDLPNGYDFQAMSQRLANELPTGTASQMINRGDSNARTTLLNSLDTGKYLVNYSGHGSTGIWAATSFYGPTDPQNMANGNNLTIFTMLTCLNGYFLIPTLDSLSESILKAPNGGGVAVWSSTGKTTPDVQEVLAKRFYQQISTGTMNRMGDLIKDAKQSVTGGRDVRLSWALLGDPTLKVK